MAAIFEVHNVLGPGFLEKVYERALTTELLLRGLRVECQKEIAVFYKGQPSGTYFADIIVENELLLELKTVDLLTRVHEAQVINYLKATGHKVGLLVNFAIPRVDYRRFAL